MNWREVKLEDIVTFKTGKLNSNAANKEGSYPFFTCAQEVYRTSTYSFDTECVILGGNNANAIYPIFYFNGKFDAYQRTYVIEPIGKDNVRFLYYVLRNRLDSLKRSSTGATTKFLTMKILNSFKIKIPDLDTQSEIASIISHYDMLIENNEKRIKILEESAQRLYEEWFVDYKIPTSNDWTEKTLDEVADILFGYNFKSKSFSEHPVGNKVIRIRDILSGDGVTYTEEAVSEKYKIIPGDLVIGMDGIFHMSVWHIKDCYLNQRVARIRSDLPSTFIRESIKKQLEFFQKTIVGSTVGHLSNSNIREFKILIPDDINLIRPFKQYELQIRKLFVMNKNLSKTKDLLIENLITGKRELNDTTR